MARTLPRRVPGTEGQCAGSEAAAKGFRHTAGQKRDGPPRGQFAGDSCLRIVPTTRLQNRPKPTETFIVGFTALRVFIDVGIFERTPPYPGKLYITGRAIKRSNRTPNASKSSGHFCRIVTTRLAASSPRALRPPPGPSDTPRCRASGSK